MYCQKCNFQNEDNAKFCTRCGCNLQVEVSENLVCPVCGKEFLSGIKFCTIDGSKLVSRTALTPRCQKCGKDYPSGIKFCPEDGGRIVSDASIGGGQKASPISTDGMPETYQWQSIVVFILCIVPLGLIITLPEIFWASQIKKLYLSGDVEAAKKLSKRSRNSLIWSIICTVAFWVIVIISVNA